MNWAAIIMQLLPALVSAVETVAADQGKPIDQVVGDVINHLTPGKPGAPALS